MDSIQKGKKSQRKLQNVHQKDISQANTDFSEIEHPPEHHYSILNITEQTPEDEIELELYLLFQTSSSDPDSLNFLLLKSAKENLPNLSFFLLAKGLSWKFADINFRRFDGKSALHLASIHGNSKVLEILLEFTEICDVEDNNFRTPLHYACLEKNEQAIHILILKGASPNKQDYLGNSPTHYAMKEGLNKIIHLFLEKGANLCLVNNKNENPFRMAKSRTIKGFIGNLKVKKVEIPKSSSEEEEPEQGNFSVPKLHITEESDEEENKLFEEDSESESESFESIPVDSNGFNPLKIDVIKKLGEGSFGEVYLVSYETSLYAMKILKKKLIYDQGIERYALAERNILCKVSHPFIVSLNYAFESDSKLYLLIDYCEGGTLCSYLDEENRFSEERTRMYSAELVLALEELHRNNIIYRDLKPENIMIDTYGHIKITDFGLSKEGILKNEITASFCGSPAYMAPEMIERSGHGQSIDWYHLGVVIFEMLTGIPPFYTSQEHRLYENIQNSELKFPSYVSESARHLIKGLLEKKPERRLNGREIKSHEFFKTIDWKKVENRELPVPYPRLTSEKKETAVMPNFYRVSREVSDSNLPGWSFINKIKFVD